MEAMVILPDHIHCIWQLPPTDDDYSSRWKFIKASFTKEYIRRVGGVPAKPTRTGRVSGAAAEPTLSMQKKGEKGIWQRRFWEHTIRDERDYNLHCDYNGAFTVSYSYDATTGHLSRVTDSLTGRQIDFIYDNDLRNTDIHRPNGVNTILTWNIGKKMGSGIGNTVCSSENRDASHLNNGGVLDKGIQLGSVGKAEAKSRKRRDVEIRDPEMILTFIKARFRMTKREEETP